MKAKSGKLKARLNYDALVAAISHVHRQAQAGAIGTVNRHLVLRNWIIGAYLVEFEQNGEDRAKYGAGLLKRLSADLCNCGVTGASPDMLERMRLFYQRYPPLGACFSAPAVRNLFNQLPNRKLKISAPVVRKSSAARTRPRLNTPSPGWTRSFLYRATLWHCRNRKN
jgi:hypothetical protein